jgi:ADP-heptose:LPS heptosyltransferase
MLVAAPERWDEACFAVPAVRALIASGLGMGVICPEEQREFWQTITPLEIVSFSPRTRIRVIVTEIRDSWKAALLWDVGVATDAVKAAGIPRRLGPGGRQLKKWLTHPLSDVEKPLEHRVRYYLAAVEEMGVHTRDPRFFMPADTGIAPVTKAVLLSPDSDYGPTHEWPLERWVEIGKRLAHDGCRLTVAGMAGGRGLGRSLATNLGKRVEFFEASPLAGALPLLAVHHLIVAADGSLSHLAAHVGSTCITFFGPNEPGWRRPLGRRHVVVKQHVECAPCFLTKCPLDLRCQKELDIERAWQTIQEKLAEANCK